MTDENRYWVEDAANETNQLNEITEAIPGSFVVCGLVDEEAGGIIAYGSFNYLNAIAANLNASAGVAP
jgi:hypothetical protein